MTLFAIHVTTTIVLQYEFEHTCNIYKVSNFTFLFIGFAFDNYGASVILIFSEE